MARGVIFRFKNFELTFKELLISPIFFPLLLVYMLGAGISKFCIQCMQMLTNWANK